MAGRETTSELDSEEEKMYPSNMVPRRSISSRIGAALLATLVLVNNATCLCAQGVLSYDTLAATRSDSMDELWEIACSPTSNLGNACKEQNMPAKRMNLESGYDVYSPETWQRLRAEARVRAPKRLWIALPCTVWSSS